MKKAKTVLLVGSVSLISGVALYAHYLIVGVSVGEDGVLNEEFAAGVLGAFFSLVGLVLVSTSAVMAMIGRARR